MLSQIKDEQVIDYTEERIKGTWGEMEGLVAKGLVKAIGISNFTITKTETLLKNAKIAPAVNQGVLHAHTLMYISGFSAETVSSVTFSLQWRVTRTSNRSN